MGLPALHSIVLSPGKSGPPIIVLHGWGHNVEIIRPLAERLAEFAEVHVLDLPGHGKTPEPDSIWGMQEFAESVAQYLDTAGIRQADFLGHSFGGKTAIKLSSLRPELFRRLVLLNSSGIKPKRSLKKRMYFNALALLRWGVKKIDRFVNLKLFENWFIPKFASPDYLNAGTIRKTFVRTLHEEMHTELAALPVPALLVWGELDTETPLELGKRMAALIPDAQMVVLEGKGHEPFHGPGAHLCSYHIAPFLSEGRERETPRSGESNA